MLSSRHAFLPLNPHPRRLGFSPHFADEETETQRGGEGLAQGHTRSQVPGFNSGLCDSPAHCTGCVWGRGERATWVA